MQIIYWSTSKQGREGEKEFTTKEQAQADIEENNYYCGLVVEEIVTDEYFLTLTKG